MKMTSVFSDFVAKLQPWSWLYELFGSCCMTTFFGCISLGISSVAGLDSPWATYICYVSLSIPFIAFYRSMHPFLGLPGLRYFFRDPQTSFLLACVFLLSFGFRTLKFWISTNCKPNLI